jgi:uncharacterized protein
MARSRQHHRAREVVRSRASIPELLPTCRLIVVKVASRCNLNCSYCYVYNLGDTSYLHQPAIMSHATVDALVARTAEHCVCHRLTEFSFVFHGGEPLLAPPSYFRYFVAQVAASIPAETTIRYFLQTNGIKLTHSWCALLRALDIKVGISLDGPKEINDRSRLDHSGRGSYDRARRGWETAVSSGLEPGLLTVVDIAAAPRRIFDHLRELSPRMVDFLLPDATHDKPPAQITDHNTLTPYADWLLEMFHIWIADDLAGFRIRLFEQIINGILGSAGKLDALGRGTNEVLVVESNGAIEPVDVLKVCADRITSTSFNVKDHSLDEALGHSMIQLYFYSNERICAICQKCKVKQVCAGGYLPHRYSATNGFDNPSVYCRELMKLIAGIQNWVYDRMPQDLANQIQFAPLAYADVLAAVAPDGPLAEVSL